MALEIVTPPPPGEVTRNIVLYGPPGIGKSTGALTAPGPILYLNSEGGGGLEYGRTLHPAEHILEVAVTGRDVLREAMLALRDGSLGAKSVVLDSSGETYRTLVDEGAGQGRPLVQHYGDAGNDLQRFCRFVRDLPVNLVVVAHEELTDGPDGALMVPQCGGNKNGPIITGMVDHVAYVGVVTPEDGEPKRVGQLAPGNKRYAKDRGGHLGVVRDLDLAEWVAAVAAAQNPNQEALAA